MDGKCSCLGQDGYDDSVSNPIFMIGTNSAECDVCKPLMTSSIKAIDAKNCQIHMIAPTLPHEKFSFQIFTCLEWFPLQLR